MEIKFKKIHYLILTLALVLLIGGIMLISFFLVKPIEEENKRIQEALRVEQTSLAVAQKQVEAMDNQSYESSFGLQKQVPVVPLIEQVLLMIEKVEVMSHNKVLNIAISTEGGGEKTGENGGMAEMPTFAEGEGSQKETEPIADLLAGTKKVTFTLSVESKDYEGMQDFIRRLDSQERIVTIESVTFSENKEKETDSLKYTVVFSTFYAPNLPGLEDGIPHIDVPDSSDKKNPLKQ